MNFWSLTEDYLLSRRCVALNDTGIAAVDGNYGGTIPESNVSQADVMITGINRQAISATAAAEAFDEPLTVAEVLALVAPFGVS